MPCDRGEPDYDRCEQPNPVTPTKLQYNAGACHYNLDAENSEWKFNSDEPGLSHSVRKRGGESINRIWNYILLATHRPTLPMIVLNSILLTLRPWFFGFLEKSSEICVRFPICLLARLSVGIDISEEGYRLFPSILRICCIYSISKFFVINNHSSYLGRNISKFSADCGTL